MEETIYSFITSPRGSMAWNIHILIQYREIEQKKIRKKEGKVQKHTGCEVET